MPAEDSKLHNELKGKLTNLSNGVKKHSGDSDFPNNITSQLIDTQLTKLVDARTSMDDAYSKAHQLGDVYEKVFEETETFFSQVSNQLYGVYGKQNLIVEDFGLRTHQKPTGRKPKATTPTA